MSLLTVKQVLQEAVEGCVECGLCTKRCCVLQGAPAVEGETCLSEGRTYTVGSVAKAFLGAFEGENASEDEVCQRVRTIADARPDLVFSVKRCFMCGFCTVNCPTQVNARAVFTSLRELFTLAGLTNLKYFSMTQVDHEWHCFSAYRAVYGIWYVDLPGIEDAPERGAHTVFFPGCPLASYAPELTRAAFQWLQDNCGPCVMTDACCGSPLKTAGRGDRAQAHKDALVERILDAGIRRVVGVCPGCVDELRGAARGGELEFVALPQLLADAGVRVRLDEPTVVAPLDSCHDRSGMFGRPLRTLLDAPNVRVSELAHHGVQALCCGGAGSVSAVDPSMKTQRIDALMVGEATEAGAQMLVSNCPTCTYTQAQRRFNQKRAGEPVSAAVPYNYLELVFGQRFDWDVVFSQLEGMWSGEYAPWLYSVLM